MERRRVISASVKTSADNVEATLKN